MGAQDGIKHVVVLMLENRSFDCMLGKLYPKSAAFEGLSGTETNLFRTPTGLVPKAVWSSGSMDPLSASIPDPDPGELFADMTQQLYGEGGRRNGDPAPMSGFIANYMAQPPSDQPYDPVAVMHIFTPQQVPVISTLARAFGVCDQWHASTPCQTWPNRFFAHTATALGHVENSQFHIPFAAPSIFRRLSDADRSWRVYFHDVPQSITLGDIWLEAFFHFRFFGQFLADAHDGALPDYSFIEPRYFTDFGLGIPNDQHPPHNAAYGEQLIAAVYNAVRSSPNWKSTLLVITYDEHGGCFDHMPPPAAVPPDAARFAGFNFDSYGVRVPAVIVSPYMPPGSIVRVRPEGLPHQGPPYPFDHTSIIATLRKLFDLGAPLTARDAVAPDLIGPLSLDDPTNDGPLSVTASNVQASAAELATRASAPLNGIQDGLSRMAAQLPPAPLPQGADVPRPSATAEPSFDNVIQAAADAVARVKSFLGL
jgi:phospholipase C